MYDNSIECGCIDKLLLVWCRARIHQQTLLNDCTGSTANTHSPLWVMPCGQTETNDSVARHDRIQSIHCQRYTITNRPTNANRARARARTENKKRYGFTQLEQSSTMSVARDRHDERSRNEMKKKKTIRVHGRDAGTKHGGAHNPTNRFSVFLWLRMRKQGERAHRIINENSFLLFPSRPNQRFLFVFLGFVCSRCCCCWGVNGKKIEFSLCEVFRIHQANDQFGTAP